MTRALSWRILGAGLLLAVMLVGLVVSESRARAAGQEVLLPMEAVDPRNLLTGHYSSLRLTQQLAPGQNCPARNTSYREGGWLALAKADGHHRFVGTARTREAALKLGEVAVRGGVYCARTAFAEGEQNAVTLDIGVDRFHADQAEAQAMDKALAARRPGEAANAFAAVSVGRDGRARLKGVILDGKRTDLT
ncbi:GDYXXLXY domain-containing protein [Phenylobacterium koreense]|uniref:Membrane-anchored protein n=1 Tax=Phenylobacterium koreense TaxID=266125 RepID=A0ABV2EIY6_9CAUL